MAKKTRTQYAPSLKLQVIGEANAEGASPTEVARKHGIAPNMLYNWRKSEPKIRKAAKKEIAQGKTQPNGATNGATHTASPKAPEEPKSGLKISGLTPLIRELVIAELAKELPTIVASEIQKRFAR